jgi:apolipoprotein N-acyltransferase
MTEHAQPLGPLRRAGLVFGAWGLLVAAGPGALSGAGLPWLGVIAMGAWAAGASRPGRFAFAIEWLAGSFGLGATMFWIAYVFQAALPPAAIGMGLYMAVAGWALRRLVGGSALPLGVAAALAWVSVETLRDLFEPPIGMGWLRVGHLATAWPGWLGGARVFGVEGLSFSIVALGAGLWGAWRTQGPARRAELVAACAPAALVVAAGWLVPAPRVAEGPRLLLVQPSIGVYEKQGRWTAQQRLNHQLELTRDGLGRASGPIDLVCWPETSAPVDALGSGVADAIRAGIDFVPWRGEERWEPELLLDWPAVERMQIGRRVFDLLPPGAAFSCGLEEWVVHDGYLRRRNALGLWQREGGRDELSFASGAKQKLAPGGETVLGLERFELVRGWIFEAAGYLPDFLAAERSEVLLLRARDGREVHVGATVCFDNAFQGPYLETVAREPVDFFLMASNESWYRGSWELDQMIAFSKALAVMSGRALARVTNSGVSAVVGPDGRERARLRVDGVDREVAGTLEVLVPVPEGGAAGAPKPPYGRYAGALRWLLGLGGLVLAGIYGRRSGDRPREGR